MCAKQLDEQAREQINRRYPTQVLQDSVTSYFTSWVWNLDCYNKELQSSISFRYEYPINSEGVFKRRPNVEWTYTTETDLLHNLKKI